MAGNDTDARAQQQTRCEGYTMALADFESMGQSQTTNEPIEAEFEPEHIPESELKDFMADGKRTA